MGRNVLYKVLALSTMAGACTLGAASAGAQSAEVSARERESAGEAYDRGTAALLHRDYARAAQWFETANRLAPASAALIEAVRAHERAGNQMRAATLALRLTALYPNERAAERAAQRALRRASEYVRVDVECAECTIQLDGTVMEYPSFFVEAGREHAVEAAFEHGSRQQSVQGSAGDHRTLRFEAPPPPPPERRVEPTPVQPPPPSGGIDVIPMWVTIGAAAATAVVGGVLIWSGIDTLDGVPAYEMNPTPAGLADGQARETRTNWLIGVTSALGLITVALAIFTDWDGEQAPVRADLLLDSEGGALSVRGRF